MRLIRVLFVNDFAFGGLYHFIDKFTHRYNADIYLKLSDNPDLYSDLLKVCNLYDKLIDVIFNLLLQLLCFTTRIAGFRRLQFGCFYSIDQYNVQNI